MNTKDERISELQRQFAQAQQHLRMLEQQERAGKMQFLSNKIYRVKVRSGIPWETYWIFKPSKEQLLGLLETAFAGAEHANLRATIQTGITSNLISIQEEEIIEEQIG